MAAGPPSPTPPACTPTNASTTLACGQQGIACATPDGSLMCMCSEGYSGVGDFHLVNDNCYIFFPVVYGICSLILLVDVCILYIVYRAISNWTISKFFRLLRTWDAPARITLMGLTVAILQIVWASIRISDVRTKVIGNDPAVSIFNGLSIICIYTMAPQVLQHCARLTFSPARLRMLDMIGREKAEKRSKLVKPLVNFILPFCAVISGIGPMVSINNPGLILTGLHVISVASTIFLLLTIFLIRVLISPMVEDMQYAVSLKRFNDSEQEALTNATRNLVFFEWILLIVSLLYLPVFLIWGFVTELGGTITYIYLLGGLFCGMLCVAIVAILTNILPLRGLPSTFRRSKRKPIDENPKADILIDMSSSPGPT